MLESGMKERGCCVVASIRFGKNSRLQYNSHCVTIPITRCGVRIRKPEASDLTTRCIAASIASHHVGIGPSVANVRGSY